MKNRLRSATNTAGRRMAGARSLWRAAGMKDAMFGKPIQPTIPIAQNEMSIEAQKLAGKLSISGVQPKLSSLTET